MPITRRAVLLAAAAMPFARVAPAQAVRRIQVISDPNCECCTAWVEHLAANGFEPIVEEMHAGLLVALKAERGVPLTLRSCHTAEVDGYVIEGHVPAADIARLLAERPVGGRGLAVPGMPYGSPGMGDESRREAYEVFLFRADGSHEVWAAYTAS